MPDKKGKVWGVIFNINDEERRLLKAFERGYEQRTIEILIPQENNTIKAETFIASANKPDVPPTAKYFSLILEGAKFYGFPDYYIKMLATVHTKD